MTSDPFDFAANVERFTGFADLYHEQRPHPPALVVDLLARWASLGKPRLIVDLGCGTGLSTRVWAAKAERVIGVDPSPDMLAQAQAQSTAANIEYRHGHSHQTGLPGQCADLILCSQSLHWMDPPGTFAEAARVLRPGGVFASIDADWPPTTSSWEADAAYVEFADNVKKLEKMHGVSAGLIKWDKETHLSRMRQSGCFRFAEEILIHHVEPGNAARLVGLAASQGSVAGLLKKGLSRVEVGLDALEAAAQRALGDTPKDWHFSYRVRAGVV